jgi:hypothetical protein
MKATSKHIPFPCKELNPESSKYEAGVTATLQRLWVQLLKCFCSNGVHPWPPSAPVQWQIFRSVFLPSPPLKAQGGRAFSKHRST